MEVNSILNHNEYFVDLEDVAVVTRYNPLPKNHSILQHIETQSQLQNALCQKPLFWAQMSVHDAGFTIVEAVYFCRDKRKAAQLTQFVEQYPQYTVENVEVAGQIFQALLMPKGTVTKQSVSEFFNVFFEFSRPLHKYRATFYYPFDLEGDTVLKHKLDAKLSDDNKRKVSLSRGDLNISAPRYTFHSIGTDQDKWSQEDNTEVQTFLYYNPEAQACFFGEKPDSNNSVNTFEEYRLKLDNCFLGIDTPEKKQARLQRQQSRAKQNAMYEHDDVAPEQVQALTQNDHSPCARIFELALVRHPISRGSFLMAINAEYSPPQDVFKHAVSVLRTIQKQQKQCLYKGTITDDIWWWCILLAPYDESLKTSLKQMQLGRWLNFSNKARILYPTFVEQKEEEKIDCLVLFLNNVEHLTYDCSKPKGLTSLNQQQDNRQPISRYVMRLLSLFFTQQNTPKEQDNIIKKLDPLSHNQHDSRLYLNATYGLCGGYPQSQLGEEVLAQITSLATMVDVQKNRFDFYPTGYAYNKEFVTNLIDSQAYRRWKGIGSETGFNESGTVTVGFGAYASDHIFPHWHTIYRHFFNYALLTREALTCFKRAMNQATDKLAGENTSTKPENNYREIRRNFVLFMNRYWFKHLSHEQQGLEIFSKLYTAKSLDMHFNLVKEQVSFADDYMESWRNIYFVNKADHTGQVATLLALLAIASAWPSDLPVFSSDIFSRFLLVVLIGFFILLGVKTKLFSAIYGLLDFASLPRSLYQYAYHKISSMPFIRHFFSKGEKELVQHYETHWDDRLAQAIKQTHPSQGMSTLASKPLLKYALIRVQAIHMNVHQNMTARHAVLSLASKLSELEALSLEHTQGIYRVDNNLVHELAERIERALQHEYKGIQFVVNHIEGVTNDNFIESKQALLKAGQSRGELLSIEMCTHSNESVNLDGTRGYCQQQAFYEAELSDYAKLAKLNNPKFVKRYYANGFDQISNDQGFVNLDSKLAYLYFSGNQLSKIKQEYVQTADDLLHFEKHIRQLKGELLHKLLSYLESNEDAVFTDMIKDHKGNKAILRIKLETLLWGNEQTLFVLPASQGFKVLAKLMAWTKGWSISKKSTEANGSPVTTTYPLTQVFSLVFCHHDAPASLIQQHAINLTKSVNYDGTNNGYRVAVLEQGDLACLEAHDNITCYFGDKAAYMKSIVPASLKMMDLCNLGSELRHFVVKDTIENLASNHESMAALLVAEQQFAFTAGIDSTQLHAFMSLASKVLMGDEIAFESSLSQRQSMWLLLVEFWDYIRLEYQHETLSSASTTQIHSVSH
ncbi:hypothetical protein [Pseudoalteromonas luteoviolacea]|uniref:Uncharacterized protein n=1 Tax=Pseudoalteromonas luteoviolacea H33 TaxID=1365251 RepID=A0A167F662_9GAMM|nr:hypothetical protein [Pseudoalteromonas luteoviolacea]KZN51733.1 hypothetical protein N476_11850 [Pseudoalteromonas luteoviolacea H33]KZN72738.1 hypothetical protein N477_24390 [Pseudoalteromonas luteoviolacea H33-S]